jgi:hypothetical protein
MQSQVPHSSYQFNPNYRFQTVEENPASSSSPHFTKHMVVNLLHD